MITQADLDECNAWIAASDERTSTAPHPDAPPVPFGAGASAQPLAVHGAAPAPAAPSLNAKPETRNAEPPAARGRWDANPIETPLSRDLAQMIAVLKSVSDETLLQWLTIASQQEHNGWRDFNSIQNATAHLRRLASDLFNQLAECEQRLAMARYQKRKQTA